MNSKCKIFLNLTTRTFFKFTAVVILFILTLPCYAAEKRLENTNKSIWKKYINHEEGFEFMYPSYFTISKDSGRYTVINAPGDIERVSLSFSPLWKRWDGSTLGQFMHNDTAYEEHIKLEMFYDNESTTTINGITVYVFHKTLGSHDEQHFFFLKDENSGVNALYSLTGYDDSNKKRVKLERVYRKIISTFRFIKSK